MSHGSIGWTVAAAVTALCLAGCGGDGGEQAGTEPFAGTALTIYSSLAEHGPDADETKAIQNGARLALEERGGKVGRYTVRYRPLDDSLASSGAPDEGKARQNARRAAVDRSTAGYIGEHDSGLSKTVIPILNQVGIAQVSTTNTYVGLTTGEAGSEPGEPFKYYPTDTRTYARIVPRDTVQARALARAAGEAGCRRVRIWHSKTTYGTGLAEGVLGAAGDEELEVAGSEEILPEMSNYRSLAQKIDAGCLVWTGELELNAPQALADAVAANPKLQVFAGHASCTDVATGPGQGIPSSVAPRFRCTRPTLGPSGLGPEGRRVLARYRKRHGGGPAGAHALYGYEAMALLLDAIEGAQRGGELTQARVVGAVFDTRDRNSPLGTYSIDENGDTTLTDYGLYRIDGRELVFERRLELASRG